MEKFCHCGCAHFVPITIRGEVHDVGNVRWKDPDMTHYDCECCSEKYHKWMKKFGNTLPSHLPDDAFNEFESCYEPLEYVKHLNNANKLAQELLTRLNAK